MTYAQSVAIEHYRFRLSQGWSETMIRQEAIACLRMAKVGERARLRSAEWAFARAWGQCVSPSPASCGRKAA